jgi:homoserine dehydrogenase
LQIPLLLVGFGNVGQAFISHLSTKAGYIHDRFDLDLPIVGAVHRSGGEFHSVHSERALDLNRLLQIKRETGQLSGYRDYGGKMSPVELIKETDAKIMLEATPTNLRNGEPALTHIKTALNSGMSVVTANKGPIAFALKELRQLAQANEADLRYSASVAGALPIIPTGYYSLMGCEVRSVEGILNGTTNFILTEMEEKKKSLEEAVQEAKRLGIPEADPRLDVEGWDTAVKLLICANTIMDLNAKISDVRVSGIQNVTLETIQTARRNGHALKLIGSAQGTSNDFKLEVCLKEISTDHPFYSVGGTWKAAMFDTDLLGNILLLGGKSSPEFAAGAMLRDILNLVHDRH